MSTPKEGRKNKVSDISNKVTILWVGRFRLTMGYDNMTRNYYKLLRDSGINNVFIDSKTLEVIGKPSLSSLKVRKLSDGIVLRAEDPDERVLMVVNETPNKYDQFDIAGKVRKVGYTMFETYDLPSDWREPLLLMDEIWVPSDFNIETFTDSFIPECMLHKMPLPIDISSFPAVNKLELKNMNKFKFLTVMSSHSRKDLSLAIKSYYKAFSAADDVSFIVKVNSKVDVESLISILNRNLFPDYDIRNPNLPHVAIIKSEMEDRKMAELYNSVDVYVSTERGKGWDLPSFEAMASGIPVINTDWSGNTEFMTRENSLLVPPEKYDEFCAEDITSESKLYGGQLWPMVSTEAFSEAMRQMYDNPELRKELGKKGRKSIEENYSYDATVKRLENYLDKLESHHFLSNFNAVIKIFSHSNLSDILTEKQIPAEYEDVAEASPEILVPCKGKSDVEDWIANRRKIWEEYGSIVPPIEEVGRLANLRNKFYGEDIFILGNGPSIAKTDVEKLNDYYSFGVNRIYLLFEKYSWRPDFFTCLDWRVVPDNFEEINSLQNMMLFFPVRFHGLLRQGQDVFWFNSRNYGKSLTKKFAPDIRNGLRGGGTVVIAALQLAYFLGFRRFFLLGVDASYSIPKTVKQSGGDLFNTSTQLKLESTEDDDINHFDKRYFGKGKKWHDPNVDEMKRGFFNMRRYLESHGAEIYNSTIGGELEALKRMDFDAALELAKRKNR
jgi:glycosyltransferase involved in cell wall biosynthesis